MMVLHYRRQAGYQCQGPDAHRKQAVSVYVVQQQHGVLPVLCVQGVTSVGQQWTVKCLM